MGEMTFQEVGENISDVFKDHPYIAGGSVLIVVGVGLLVARSKSNTAQAVYQPAYIPEDYSEPVQAGTEGGVSESELYALGESFNTAIEQQAKNFEEVIEQTADTQYQYMQAQEQYFSNMIEEQNENWASQFEAQQDRYMDFQEEIVLGMENQQQTLNEQLAALSESFSAQIDELSIEPYYEMPYVETIPIEDVPVATGKKDPIYVADGNDRYKRVYSTNGTYQDYYVGKINGSEARGNPDSNSGYTPSKSSSRGSSNSGRTKSSVKVTDGAGNQYTRNYSSNGTYKDTYSGKADGSEAKGNPDANSGYRPG